MIIQPLALIIVYSFLLYETVYPLKHIYRSKGAKIAQNYHHLRNRNKHQKVLKARKGPIQSVRITAETGNSGVFPISGWEMNVRPKPNGYTIQVDHLSLCMCPCVWFLFSFTVFLFDTYLFIFYNYFNLILIYLYNVASGVELQTEY